MLNDESSRRQLRSRFCLIDHSAFRIHHSEEGRSVAKSFRGSFFGRAGVDVSGANDSSIFAGTGAGISPLAASGVGGSDGASFSSGEPVIRAGSDSPLAGIM